MTPPTVSDLEKEWLVGNTFTGGPVNRFDVLTDQNAIILQGSRDEAEDQTLTGKVVLDLKQPINGKVRLRFSRKIRHRHRMPLAGDPYSTSMSLVELVSNVSDLDSNIVSGEGEKLGAGLHEFPFSFTIPGSTPPSLEGPLYTYVIYRLKCTVERGRFAKDLITKKHVRIHRTFRSDSLAFQHAVQTESFWEGKCAYRIEIPHKGIIFGTSVPLEYRISPLKKGVTPARVRCQLEQKIVVNPDHFAVGTRPLASREVTKLVCDGSEEVQPDLELNEEGWYVFHQRLELPRELSKVVQTYSEPLLKDIRVKHTIYYQIGLTNPEGHLSEVQGEMDIILYFTRQMHVEDNAVTGQPDSSEDSTALEAPPDYQHSRLDLLYDEVSHSGYATPLPRSGAVTPRGNSVSAPNLQALLEDQDGEAYGNSEDEDDAVSHEAHANTLRNRLDQIVNPISSSYERNGLLGNHSSGQASPVAIQVSPFPESMSLSPRSRSGLTPSREQGNPLDRPAYQRSHTSASIQSHSPHTGSAQVTRPNSPVHIEALSRVPSYGTALRTPAPVGEYGAQHGAGDGAHLPTYEDASRNNSVDTGTTPPNGVSSTRVLGMLSRIRGNK